MKIDKHNISDIHFDPRTHYIRSDLEIIKKEDWNKRTGFAKFRDWMRKVTINPIIVAAKIKRLTDRVCASDKLNIPFENIHRNFEIFEKGLKTQLSDSLKRGQLDYLCNQIHKQLSIYTCLSPHKGDGGFVYLEQ